MAARRDVLLFSALAGVFACAAPRLPAPKAPKRAPTEDERLVDQREFYMAVAAYEQGRYEECDAYLRAILAVDPSNTEALGLRQRLRAAQKAAAAPNP